jgi:hypothetical protein
MNDSETERDGEAAPAAAKGCMRQPIPAICEHVRPRPPFLRCQRDQARFSIPPHRPTPNFPANWNVAPTADLPIVRFDARAGERSLDMMRWGLVPYWAKDLKIGF